MSAVSLRFRSESGLERVRVWGLVPSSHPYRILSGRSCPRLSETSPHLECGFQDLCLCSTPSHGVCGLLKAAESSHSRRWKGCWVEEYLCVRQCLWGSAWLVCATLFSVCMSLCVCLCVCLDRVCLCGSVCVCSPVRTYMWGREGVLCLGGVSASGCVSLSIPRSLSSCCPTVPAEMGWK